MVPPDVVLAVYIEPFPDVAPIVFPVTVPMFTFPDVTAIPQNIPFVVVAPLDVYNAKPAIVLFCIDDIAPAAVNAQLIATYLVALAVPPEVYELGNVPPSEPEVIPIMLVVPVPLELLYPITLPVIVYPLPEEIKIP